MEDMLMLVGHTGVVIISILAAIGTVDTGGDFACDGTGTTRPPGHRAGVFFCLDSTRILMRTVQPWKFASCCLPQC
jgi:hypothetical protein